MISAGAPQVELGAVAPSDVSGTWRRVITIVTAAIGRLMKNTGRHDTASTSQPPTNGPTAPAAAPNPAHAPTARDRSSGWNDAEMIARLLGTSRAPATPWRARAAMSTSMVGASPHSREATPNPARPDDEDPPPPVEVAERASQQQQRRERHEIGVESPLQPGETPAEVLADVRQGDVDDGGVEEGDARAGHAWPRSPIARRKYRSEGSGQPPGRPCTSDISGERTGRAPYRPPVPPLWQCAGHAARTRPRQHGLDEPARRAGSGRSGGGGGGVRLGVGGRAHRPARSAGAAVADGARRIRRSTRCSR